MILGVKEKMALWRYSTHLNDQVSPSQHVARNQCLQRYELVLLSTVY
jgi:hypothetical protein